MRSMARTKGLSGIQKFLIVAGVLVLIQVVMIFYFSQTKQHSQDFKQIVDKMVNESGSIEPANRALVKLQLALNAYREQNQKFPDELSQLVPEFMDAVPVNPATSKEFEYRVVNGQYILEDSSSAGTATAAGKTKNEQERFLALLDQDIEESTFVYDASGKRDPFRSFDFAPRRLTPVGDSALECCDYDELRLVAVLEGIGEPRASIETPDGKGVLAAVGEVVGMYGGKVVKIDPDKITILETVESFTGEKETRTVEMFLRR